jgi:RecJ-like exonuclease
MLKHLSIFIFATLLFVACNKTEQTPQKVAKEAKIFQVEDLNNNSFEYKAGDTVTVDGLCVHVCKHSGKKLFIIGKTEAAKLQVFTSEVIPAFDMKLNGSKLRLAGTLEEEKIDSNVIAEMESDVIKESKENKESCPTEESMKEVKDLKARLALSKKGYISIYSMNCLKVTTL